MKKSKTTAQLLQEAIKENAKRPSAERANDMIARGVVNHKGELTTLVGGTAEPEKVTEVQTDKYYLYVALVTSLKFFICLLGLYCVVYCLLGI